MTRVKYVNVDGVLVSRHELLAVNELVLVTINLNDFSYAIKNMQGLVRVNGSGRTLPEAQKLVKRDLKALGVNFNDEVRERNKATPFVEYSDLTTDVQKA